MSLQTGDSNTSGLVRAFLRDDDTGVTEHVSFWDRWLYRTLPVVVVALMVLALLLAHSPDSLQLDEPNAVGIARSAGSVGNAFIGSPPRIKDIAAPAGSPGSPGSPGSLGSPGSPGSPGSLGSLGSLGSQGSLPPTALDPSHPALHRPLPGLAELRVLYRRPLGGRERFDRLASGALRRGRVTVLNLWATFCGPCKEEFPGLNDLLSSEDAAKSLRHVDFVPILVDNGVSLKRARVLYEQLGGPMASAFVADVELSGGVRQVLVQAGLIGDDLRLPMTLVLDCHARLRWFHRGALQEAEFRELAAVLSTLDGEIGSKLCPRRRSKKKTRPRVSVGSDASDGSAGAKDSADSTDAAGKRVEPKSADSTDAAGKRVEPKSADSESAGGSGKRAVPLDGCDDDGTCEPQRGENSVNCPTDCRPEISKDLQNFF